MEDSGRRVTSSTNLGRRNMATRSTCLPLPLCSALQWTSEFLKEANDWADSYFHLRLYRGTNLPALLPNSFHMVSQCVDRLNQLWPHNPDHTPFMKHFFYEVEKDVGMIF